MPLLGASYDTHGGVNLFLTYKPTGSNNFGQFQFLHGGNKLIVVDTPVVIFLFLLDADFLPVRYQPCNCIFYDSRILRATVRSKAWLASKISQSQPGALEIPPSGS